MIENIMAKILIVDDEKDIADLISYNLEREGFRTRIVLDGNEALAAVRSFAPDLMVLDLMLPGVGGLDICKRIRANPETSSLPIIMLTAKADEVDKIIGLEIGADDYVTKPFSVKELVARVRTVLRRVQEGKKPSAKERFEFQGLSIDYGSCSVQVEGRPVTLSPTELKLLFFLSRNPAACIHGIRFLRRSGATTPLLPIAPWMSISAACAARSKKIWKNRNIF